VDLLNKTKELCRIYGITPARSKGQNFLIKEDVYDKIIAAADLKVDEVILEVGPGLGFLTAKLAAKVEKVIAVELDDKLARFLRTALKKQGVKNVEILNENVLDFSIMKHVSCIKKNENNACIHNTLYNIHNTKFKIVANLPYNITSIFLRLFLSSPRPPKSFVLMLLEL
jgi:16S rRNA (adenine1518-N6/adenine1519-N6)-dimethyltransferase